MTIEFANWRISQNFLVFTKLEESSFYSITCFHQLVTNLLELWRCFFLHQPFVDRNSPWGFENLDPPKNLHKSLSNPPPKKMISLPFLGAGIHHDGAVFGLVSGDLCWKPMRLPTHQALSNLNLHYLLDPPVSDLLTPGTLMVDCLKLWGSVWTNMWFSPGGGAAPKFKTYGSKKSRQT